MITITTSGTNPKTNVQSTEIQLLIAGWSYGMQAGDSIHRFSLYAFIQSHLANKSEENLQKSLETDYQNWIKQGSGTYTLTDNGFHQIEKYGNPNMTIAIGSLFTFSTALNKYKISVTIDPNTPKYIVKQNDVITKSDVVIKAIENIAGERFNKSQRSLPREIYNWILRANNYQWTIVITDKTRIRNYNNIKPIEEDDEKTFYEGKEKYKLHKIKERNQNLVHLKKHATE